MEKDCKKSQRADMDGSSLDSAVGCRADDRKALEQPRHHNITHPTLANERMQTSAAGQVLPTRKTPWHDGTTPLVMSPI
jgi:hypothetical protein